MSSAAPEPLTEISPIEAVSIEMESATIASEYLEPFIERDLPAVSCAADLGSVALCATCPLVRLWGACPKEIRGQVDTSQQEFISQDTLFTDESISVVDTFLSDAELSTPSPYKVPERVVVQADTPEPQSSVKPVVVETVRPLRPEESYLAALFDDSITIVAGGMVAENIPVADERHEVGTVSETVMTEPAPTLLDNEISNGESENDSAVNLTIDSEVAVVPISEPPVNPVDVSNEAVTNELTSTPVAALAESLQNVIEDNGLDIKHDENVDVIEVWNEVEVEIKAEVEVEDELPYNVESNEYEAVASIDTTIEARESIESEDETITERILESGVECALEPDSQEETSSAVFGDEDDQPLPELSHITGIDGQSYATMYIQPRLPVDGLLGFDSVEDDTVKSDESPEYLHSLPSNTPSVLRRVTVRGVEILGAWVVRAIIVRVAA